MKTYSVYYLRCPYTNDVRYVGVTSHPIEARLQSHCGGATSPGVRAWIGGLDRRPVVTLVKGGLTGKEGHRLEGEEIRRLAGLGVPLLNVAKVPHAPTDVTLAFRVPRILKEWMAEQAMADGRTLSAWIRAELRRELARLDKRKARVKK